jgi:hypothetical protein
VESKAFRLRAPFSYKDASGKLVDITDAIVRLITDGEQRAVDAGAAQMRDTSFLLQSIVRLGPFKKDSTSHILTAAVLQSMPAVNTRQIREEITKLENSGCEIELAETAVSEPFKLQPGVLIDGQRITECKVRLLCRGDSKAIAAEPEDDRINAQIARCIVELGEVVDREKIARAVLGLTDGDELRIQKALASLQLANADGLIDAGTPETASVDYEVEGVEIRSARFDLKHGVRYQGRLLTSCVVRLMTRGEIGRIGRLPEARQSDASLIESIAELGDLKFDREAAGDLLGELVNSLAMIDIEIINREVASLRDSFREDLPTRAETDSSREGATGDRVPD